MNFQEPEVIEMGLAKDLIQDVAHLDTSESAMPSRIKISMAVYVADAE